KHATARSFRNSLRAKGQPRARRLDRNEGVTRLDLEKTRWSPAIICFLLVIILAAPSFVWSQAQQPIADVSKESARPTRDWVRDGVIYQIYPRAFSPQGDFNGVTARLDDLKTLVVTILWLMPIHLIGREKRKGSVGSPYAV